MNDNESCLGCFLFILFLMFFIPFILKWGIFGIGKIFDLIGYIYDIIL